MSARNLGSDPTKRKVQPLIDAGPSKRSKFSACEHAEREVLWVDKYRPRVWTELVGNNSKILQLKNWLSQWNGQKTNFRRAMLISGPPGVGKTSSAQLVCAALGFRYFEVNASDARNKSTAAVTDGMRNNVLTIVKEMISNASLTFGGETRKMALIMDEVDGMSSGDRGGVSELINIIKNSRIPIICICNDKYSPKLKGLISVCDECVYQRPLKTQIIKHVTKIGQAEGLSLTGDVTAKLVESCCNDIRLCINQLQFTSQTVFAMGNAPHTVKDIPGNPFSNTDILFSTGSQLSVSDKERLSLSDAELIPLFVHENYVNMRPYGAMSDMDRLSLSAASSSRLSEFDMICTAVYSRQHWSLLPVCTMLGAVLPASVVSGRRELIAPSPGERNFHRFPSLLGKMSSSSKVRRLCSELSSRFSTGISKGVSSSQLRLNYFALMRLRTLKEMTFTSKGGKEQEGIESVLAFMHIYKLKREDWDTLHDSTRLEGKGAFFQPPALVLCSKTKAKFTRMCKTHDL